MDNKNVISFEKVNEFLKSINKPPLPYTEINITDKNEEEIAHILKKESSKAYEWLMKYVGIIEK